MILAIKNEETSLERVYETLAKALLKAHIALGIEIDESRIEIMTEDLFDKYKGRSIEDVIYALKKGRSGYYGKVYGKLDMIIISEWIDKVSQEKAKAIIELSNKPPETSERSDKSDEWIEKWKQNVNEAAERANEKDRELAKQRREQRRKRLEQLSSKIGKNKQR